MVDVRVGAECIPPGTNFYLTGEGVTAPDLLGEKLALRGEPSPRRLPTEVPICYPKEWQSRVEIKADAPLGPAFWRLSCAQGGTGSRPFIVGDLPEFIETESNSSPERAERVEIPATINGQICGERDADYFRLVPRAAGVVVCEVLAARLGSPLDPVVELLSTDGTPQSAIVRHAGSDLIVAFTTTANQEHLLRIANVKEAGSPAHIYRINITTAESFAAAFPKEHVPNALSEAEPNDRLAEAQKLTLGVSLLGSFAGLRDDDWFRFTAEAGKPLAISCRASPIGGAALPTLLVTDAAGKELARAKSIDGPDGVCRIEWNPPAAGEYALRVRDLRGAAEESGEFAYRLAIEPALPDFSLHLASDIANVLQGAKGQIDVSVVRSSGFAGPIDLRLEGVPWPKQPGSAENTGASSVESGISLEWAQIPAGATTHKLTIAAADSAPSRSVALRLVGRAMIGDQPVERIAQSKHLGCDVAGIALGSATIDRLHVAVLHKPVFRLECAEAYQYAHRGTVYPYLMEFQRLDGFDGPITLQLGDRQNRDLDGIEMHEVVVPPGQSQVMLPIYLPETMHINVQSQSQVYSQAHASFVDKLGRKQSVLVVSEKRNMLRTLPPVVKLKAVAKQVSAAPGASCVCRFELERTSNFAGSMDLELLASTGDGKITGDKAVIAEGQTAGELSLRVAPDVPRGKSFTLKFRATGKMAGGATAVSEDEVRLVVE